jgi:GntR family transcriptional regulator/MocR family aminotransferase
VGYLVVPPPLVPVVAGLKFLVDCHTSTMQQEVLADFIDEGHFERHLRRVRARNAERRRALLEALDATLGDRVEVVGANAGMHVVAWLPGVATAGLPALVDSARLRGVGIYPATPYYVRPPRRAALLLGYSCLEPREIRAGVRLLAEVVQGAVGMRTESRGTQAQ